MGLDAISAQNALISRQALGAGAFVPIAELGDFSGPALTRNTIEMITHNDPIDFYVGGIKRRGEIEMNLKFNPHIASHKALRDAWNNDQVDVYRIAFPDGSYWQISGFISNMSPTMPVDDALTADVTIRPTGYMSFFDAP